jgi:spore maturation protein CgeB
MLGRLAGGEFGQLHPDQIPKFELYLSSTGGPWLNVFRSTYHPPRCEPLYCSVDPEVHRPEGGEPEFDLGYLGDYDGDRRAKLEEMLLKPAEHLEQGFFAVAGEGYPEDFHWPRNVIHVEHLPVTGHARFFAGQRYTLDLARREILSAGWAPTPALFEAMATGTPVISDAGRSLEPFFKIGQEILVAETAQEVLNHLARLPESSRQRLAERARGRVLASHTAAHRAEELERLLRRARNDAARAALRT